MWLIVIALLAVIFMAFGPLGVGAAVVAWLALS